MERLERASCTLLATAMIMMLFTACGETTDSESAVFGVVGAESMDALDTRLFSNIGEQYILDVTVDVSKVTDYLEDVVGNPDLTATPRGFVNFTDRIYRDDEGEQIGDDRNLGSTLFLLVRDEASPAPVSILAVESWGTNEQFVEFLYDQGLRSDRRTSMVKRKEEVERKKGRDEVETKWAVSSGRDKIKFEAEFVAQNLGLTPPILDPNDCGGPLGPTLRFASSPAQLFAQLQDRATFTPMLGAEAEDDDSDDESNDDGEVELELKVHVDGPAGSIFNEIDESDVTRFRYIRERAVIDSLP